jgi:hypothetical protein
MRQDWLARSSRQGAGRKNHPRTAFGAWRRSLSLVQKNARSGLDMPSVAFGREGWELAGNRSQALVGPRLFQEAFARARAEEGLTWLRQQFFSTGNNAHGNCHYREHGIGQPARNSTTFQGRCGMPQARAISKRKFSPRTVGVFSPVAGTRTCGYGRWTAAKNCIALTRRVMSRPWPCPPMARPNDGRGYGFAEPDAFHPTGR